MADQSKIEWTEVTWNPILGCSRVSPGCDACYAISTATIRAGNPHPKVAAAFAGLTERRDGRLDWTGRVNLLPDRLDQPLRWRKPKRIFVNSQADLFHDAVPDEYIARVFAVMARAPQHTFQLLTKRHGRMRSLLTDAAFHNAVYRLLDPYPVIQVTSGPVVGYPNLWLGVSVENQKRADLRISALLDTIGHGRWKLWLSCEPLLGPVDLSAWLTCQLCSPDSGVADLVGDVLCGCRSGADFRPALDWVVVGGESGPGARPMHPDWARSLRDQCVTAGVPYFFKQWGEWAPNGYRGIGIGQHTAGREALVGKPDSTGHREVIARVGKKAAGRELDGRTWDEYPQPAVTA